MDNKERAGLIAREYSVEELISKLAEAAGQMKKATDDMAEYLKATANVTRKDARLGALSRVFVAETGRVEAVMEVIKETFLGSGIEVETELASGRLFEEAIAKIKAEKAAKEQAFFATQEKRQDGDR